MVNYQKAGNHVVTVEIYLTVFVLMSTADSSHWLHTYRHQTSYKPVGHLLPNFQFSEHLDAVESFVEHHEHLFCHHTNWE